jgi:CheY-like chemotaxis protein
MTARKTTILLAGDKQQFLRFVSSLLRPEGHAVVTVQDREQVIGHRQALQPDQVLLDLLMPAGDGLTAWRAEQERVRRICLGALSICGRYAPRASVAPIPARRAIDWLAESCVWTGRIRRSLLPLLFTLRLTPRAGEGFSAQTSRHRRQSRVATGLDSPVLCSGGLLACTTPI